MSDLNQLACLQQRARQLVETQDRQGIRVLEKRMEDMSGAQAKRIRKAIQQAQKR